MFGAGDELRDEIYRLTKGCPVTTVAIMQLQAEIAKIVAEVIDIRTSVRRMETVITKPR